MNHLTTAPRHPLATDHLRLGTLWLAIGLLLMALIIVGSLVNIPPVGSVVLQDKVVHLCGYALLTGWFMQIYHYPPTRLALALGFVALGVGIEYLQGMVPSRQFEVLDMVANGCGVLLAWVLSQTRLGRALVAFERLIGRTPSSA